MKNWMKVVSIVLIILFCLGIVGCSSSEEDELLKKVEEQMEKGDFETAESLLNASFEGKPAKLKEALSWYNTTVTNFYNNYSIPILNDIVAAGYDTGFQDTYDSLEEIDSIYKKYEPFKDRVEEWKNRLEDAIKYEENLRNDYDQMQKYLSENNYDICIEMSEEWNEKIETKFSADDNEINGLNEEIITRLEAFTYYFSEESIRYNSIADPDSTYNTENSRESSSYNIIEEDIYTSTGEGSYSDTTVD